jgi:hypothetical protein
LAEKNFWVSEGTGWHERNISPSEGTAWHQRTVKVTQGTTWYESYPREQYYTQTFNATWSQGYKGNGEPLHDTAWYGNIITGSTTNFWGMLGFNKSAIQSFLAANVDFGGVQSAKLWINCYETTLNGSPDVTIGKHGYAAEPAEGTWLTQGVGDWGDASALHVPNQALGGYMINLNPTQITQADKRTAIGGIALRGAAATDENMGKFNGVGSYISKLEITVLK